MLRKPNHQTVDCFPARHRNKFERQATEGQFHLIIEHDVGDRYILPDISGGLAH
jgi:hypothetical protein